MATSIVRQPKYAAFNDRWRLADAIPTKGFPRHPSAMRHVPRGLYRA
jgi:hypothetical protein